MMISDFHDRLLKASLAREIPGQLYAITSKCLELARKIFGAAGDVRPISGTVANIAVLFALTQPGDKIALPNWHQGPNITAPSGVAHGLKSVHYPWTRTGTDGTPP